MIRLVEEALLLVLDDEQGDLTASYSSEVLDIVVAGAVLMELALEARIDADLERLVVADPTPLDDDLLDPALAEIAAGPDGRSADYWVARTAARGEAIRELALARLVEAEILEADAGGVFLSRFVRRSRRYPSRDGQYLEEVRLRIMRVLFSEEIPGPRDAMLICLSDASGVLRRLLPADERRRLRGRIELIGKLDLIGQSLLRAIRERRRSAEAPEKGRPASEIPEVGGLPILGSALSMTGDVNAFFARQYAALGPVFRVRALNRRLLVLAGPEATRFIQRRGSIHLRPVDEWKDYGRGLGTTQFLNAMSGPEHARLRKAMAPGFSPRHVQNRMADFMRVTRSELDGWVEGGPVRVRPALQRMIVRQTSVLCADIPSVDFTSDLDFFFGTTLAVHVARRRSKLWLKHRRVARARRHMHAYFEEIMASRENGDRRNGAPDQVDDLLELHRSDPQFFSEENLPSNLLLFLFGGLHTVAYTCVFVLYEALKRPRLLKRMRAEADALFADGMPGAPTLAQLDVTHRFIMETLRIHPIAFALQRRVTNSFTLAGYRIPAGTDVLFSLAATHLLREHFPSPGRFDIERYAPERAEHRAPGVYVPYGLGTHGCLGKGLAQMQMVLTLATVLHEVDLAMVPSRYRLKVSYGLGPRPADSFRCRARRRVGGDAAPAA